MKSFEPVSFDPVTCNQELAEFRSSLASNALLPERRLLKPFFTQRKQLSAFIGAYVPKIGPAADQLAYEWQIHGDFAADVVVGNQKTGTFCLIGLEGGGPTAIFKSRPKKSTTEWSTTFERGFSRLVDWFFALDDFRHTKDFEDDFGTGHVTFHGLLVVGRSAGLEKKDLRRLRWREERVIVNSHAIHCITYDELYEELDQRLTNYLAVAAP